VRKVASKLRAGQVILNGAGPDLMAPFGGYKMSGNGREWGDHAFGEFLETKAVLGYAPRWRRRSLGGCSVPDCPRTVRRRSSRRRDLDSPAICRCKGGSLPGGKDAVTEREKRGTPLS
jgi:hypothetical protein